MLQPRLAFKPREGGRFPTKAGIPHLGLLRPPRVADEALGGPGVIALQLVPI